MRPCYLYPKFMNLKPRLLSLIAVFCISTSVSFSQIIKGQVTDESNAPIPFAIIYDEVTYSGITCNADGFYEIRLTPGIHTLVFKAMGYYSVKKNLQITEDQTVNVTLTIQPVTIKEVVVKPGKEDPAYAIMRKVIGLAPYHQNQIKQYTADVYLRGTLQIIKIPKFVSKHTSINGKTNILKSGDAFLEESQNQIIFSAPNHYNQKVVSIRSTFPWNSEEINPMGMISASLYEPTIDNVISPLAPNAFHYYNYRYEGFIEEGGHVIFKIQVTPRHNSQQLMRGDLYIVDRLWCIHSADLAIHMFFGNMKFRITYSPFDKKAWMPINYQFFAEADIMGINANYKYNSSVTYREVIINQKKIAKATVETNQEPLIAPSSVKEAKNKNQEALEKLMSKEDLTNRDMMKMADLMARQTSMDSIQRKSLEIKESEDRKPTVEKDAVKKDTAYWNSIRPIPLTAIESNITAFEDKALLSEGQEKADSLHKPIKKKAFGKVLGSIVSGKSIALFDSTLDVRYEGLVGINNFRFNTVDGFAFQQAFTFHLKTDSSHAIQIRPAASYAFVRERFMWQTDIRYEYAPMHLGNLHFYIGSISADYNDDAGINPTINSLATLFFRRNYLKVYQQNMAAITNQIDITNGLNIKISLGYRVAQPLRNHSDFSFFYRNERDFSENLPGNDPENLLQNVSNREAFFDFSLEYTPRYYYRIQRGKKIYEESEYPTFFIRNKMALPGVANSSADYDLLEIGARQNHTWGMMHALRWKINTGIFLNRNRLFSMDYKYFNNQDIPVTIQSRYDAFRLLPYYRNATSYNFTELHIQFTTPYLLIKYLPILNNKIWCENLHLSMISTNKQLYWETGYSISQIYMVGNIGVFAGFENKTFHSAGIRAFIRLDD